MARAMAGGVATVAGLSFGTGSARLEEPRLWLDRASTAERVAEILRQRIAEGFFPPGARLAEESIGAALGVSRNTLREAFRILGHERLVAHELNRGVFVRRLSAGDVKDLYHVRRVIETAAITERAAPAQADLTGVRRAVERGEQAARDDRWPDVATADLEFHSQLVALAGSPRLDLLMRRLLAELRLAFHIMAASRRFHEPFLLRNRGLFTLLEAGNTTQAAQDLAAYLDDAEHLLLAAFAHQRTGPPAESDRG